MDAFPPWVQVLLAWLALPQHGLGTVFVVSLLSATLLPMASVPVVWGVVEINPALFWPVLLVATAGNTLGGAITYAMGWGAERAYEKVTHHPPRDARALAFEMQLAVHPGWVRRLAPLLAEAFGAQPAFEPANLQRLLTRVQPGRIRVDADELSYPAHVILRYEIERALIAGDAEADDVPALWDAKMQALLGIDTRGDLRDGPLQDVHWAEGAFGYFPCYTLGAMYAAQWFAALRREQPGFDARIGAGDLQPVYGWLHARLWSQGSLWPTDELVRRASGEPLNPAHYRAHLQARYLGD